MLRFGAIIRSLMLVVCLVPFTSVQQAAEALAPYLPVVPAPPAGEAPVGPESEEDDERETSDGKERHSAATRHRIPVREQIDRLPPAPWTHLTRPRTTPPVAEDAFRNGLGTPYRC